MAFYKLRERALPLDDSWDVIVAGGGPAGCAAAAAAASGKAKTLLIEAAGALGGMGTSGLIPWFCGYGDGEKIIARGLAERVRVALRDNMPFINNPSEEDRRAREKHPLIGPAIDTELLKRIYDDMVSSAGAKILFNSFLCSVEKTEDGAVDAVVVSSKKGLTAFKAAVYVDCTGDGDLCAWAGARFEKGDETGALQPATHCFMISNVDEDALAAGPKVHFWDPESPVRKAARSGRYPLMDLHSCNIKVAPGTFNFNAGHIYGVDNTEPESTSAALMLGRKTAAQYREAFAEYLPAFSESALCATGSLLGIRETRRIIGDYVLTGEDYEARRTFEDEVCRNAYGIDVHGSRPKSRAEIAEVLKKDTRGLEKNYSSSVRGMGPGESFGVPYRCLTPVDLRNTLVAGRCISSDRRANGSVRVMACCLNTGEAAGIAAAMSAAGSGDVHSVDTRELRNKIISRGGYLPGETGPPSPPE